MNRNFRFLIPFLAFFLVTLTSCEVVGGIFKAGVWTGFIVIVIVVAIVIWLITRFRRK